jgi:hypothetical protein
MKYSVIVAALALSSIAVVPAAHAGFNTSGAAFTAYSAAGSQCLGHSPSGAVNIVYNGSCGATSGDIIASVPRPPYQADTHVYVEYYGAGTNANWGACYLYSYDYDNTMLGSTSAAFNCGTNGAAGEIDMFFTAAQIGYWGFVSLSCHIPLGCNILGFDTLP